MEKTILVDGHAAVTINDQGEAICLQFLPDDQDCQLVKGGQVNGTAQLMRNASFDFVLNPKRKRANATLIRKAAHGRISATRDQAVQLTLKVFRREGLDIESTLRTDFEVLINNVTF